MSEINRPPRTIGILGGMGPSSTPHFLDQIYAECRVQLGCLEDEDFPHIILYSLPTPYGDGISINHEAMRNAIRGGIARIPLKANDLCALPCSSSHRYLRDLAEEFDFEILDMVTATIDALPMHVKSPGIIATRTTLEWGGFEVAAQQCDLSLIDLPDTQPAVDRVLAALTAGVDPMDLQSEWNTVLKAYEDRGCDHLIVGCTDLSVLDSWMSVVPTLDASAVLAKLAVSRLAFTPIEMTATR
jgi:amino-acid racemase